MPLPPPEAHVICGALVAIDVVARALRLRPILLGLGHAVPFTRVVALTLTCDAACAVTPYRAGGDATRLAALRRAGVPLPPAVAALVADTLVTWPVLLVVGVVVAVLGGATWWRAPLASASRAGLGSWPLGLALATALVGAAAIGAAALRRSRRRGPARTDVGIHGRPRLSPRLVAMTLPLTLVAVTCRVLVLPVLMSAEAAPFSFAGAVAGSFLLVYSQLLLPLPSGVGAVDVGLLAGAPENGGALPLLLLWRLYTSGLSLLLGLGALPLALGRTRKHEDEPSP